MEKSGFDVHAMPVFFERLQKAIRIYENGAPSYLRTHPLTYERIADIQGRIENVPFRQVLHLRIPHLVRADRLGTTQRARLLVAVYRTSDMGGLRSEEYSYVYIWSLPHLRSIFRRVLPSLYRRMRGLLRAV